MLTDHSFLFEQILDYTKEEDLYYILGRIKIESVISGQGGFYTAKEISYYNNNLLPQIENRQVIADWAKANQFPILEEDKEIIKRENWDIKQLIGTIEKQLYHPHYYFIRNYFLKNFKPKSKIAVLFLCSATKPYSQNKQFKWFIDRYKNKVDFYFISNPGIIPLEYDNYYPFRWYFWPENQETKEIKEKYIEITKERIENWFKIFNQYENIISLIKPGETYDALNLAEIRQEKHIIFTDEFMQEIENKWLFTFKQIGLLKFRYLFLKITKERFINILNKLCQ